MVQTILASRVGIYETPELQPWSNNGGSKINQKIQQLLKKLGSTIPGAAEIVAEEVAALTKTKKSTTPT
jgi:hypothetical protein